MSQLLITDELAAALRVQPQTLRKGLCLRGHYFGVTPIRCPNGRLLWPADAVERILAGATRNKTQGA